MSPRPQHSDIDEDVVDVSHYWRVLRRNKTLLAVGLLLGLALGILAANVRSPEYRSNASVVVQAVAVQTSTGALNSDAGVNIETQAEIASSPVVAERVRQALDTEESARELLADLTVTIPNRSNVLAFTYAASGAEAAQQRAQSFAESYLEVRRDQASQAVQELVDSQQERVDSVQEQLADVRAEIAAAPAGSAALRAAEVEEQVLLQQLASLQVQLNQVRSLVIEPGVVLAEASLPSSDGAVTAGAFMASFAFLGLLLATAFALLRSRTDKKVREAIDVEGRLGLPVVADLAESGARGEDMLATKLLVHARREGASTIVVAAPSAERADAVTASRAVTASVARSMALRGVRVLLVEATEGSEAPRHGAWDSLRTLSGVRVAHLDTSGSMVTPGRVAELLQAARGDADVVLVAAAPVLGTTETLLLGAESDSVLLVAERRATRTDELGAAVDDLGEFGARVLGVVLVDRAALEGRNGTPRAAGPVAPARPAQSASATSQSASSQPASPRPGSTADASAVEGSVRAAAGRR